MLKTEGFGQFHCHYKKGMVLLLKHLIEQFDAPSANRSE